MEDLIQDVFCKALVRWEEFRRLNRPRALLAFMVKVMHDRAVDTIRRLDRCRAVSLEALPAEPMAADGGESTGQLDAMEEREGLEGWLAELEAQHEGYGVLLREHYLEGKTREELAGQRDCSVKAIKSLLQRARQAAKRLAEGKRSGRKPR
jgi:RNA polymerase sigma factor (sigma-70 family)